MSNRCNIKRVEVKEIKSQDIYGSVEVFDDYGEESYYFDSVSDIPTDDMVLLKNILERQDIEGGGNLDQRVLEAVETLKKGITIDGTYYEWEKISHIFDEVEREKEG